MLDWLSSRRSNPDSGCIRYVQSQNGNLSNEFEPLREDVAELDWATECFGTPPLTYGSKDQGNILMQVTFGSETRKARPLYISVLKCLTSFCLTTDHYENLYCQILGTKTFYLIPPTEYACLNGSTVPLDSDL